MEKAKLMQLEIEEKRKLPHEVKENIKNNIFHSLIASTIILSYLAAINIMYYNLKPKKFEYYMKFFALGIIVVTVIDIELAYRKNSKKLCLIGLELLACAILSLYIPYIYIHTTDYLRNSVMLLPGILLIYYVFKSLVIFKQNQFKHRNNLSDVKELLSNDERKSYLDEESTKTYKAKMEEEEEIRKVIIKRQKMKTLQKEQENKKAKKQNKISNQKNKLKRKK